MSTKPARKLRWRRWRMTTMPAALGTKSRCARIAGLRQTRNHAAYVGRPHRLDLSTELFGDRISMPLIIAPTAVHGLATPEGEIATARAAHRAETIMTLSTLANFSIEEVALLRRVRSGFSSTYIRTEKSLKISCNARKHAVTRRWF